jgi:alpha-galactosidase
MEKETTRRQFVQQTAATMAGAAFLADAQAAPKPAGRTSPVNGFLDLNRFPDVVRVFTDAGDRTLSPTAGGRWTGPDIEVVTETKVDGLAVTLSAPKDAVKRLHLRWHGRMDACRLVLGDTWERAYGDLAWYGLIPERALPWYFAAWDGTHTHGYGVLTGPNAFCFWQADAEGISLWDDVRSGGGGVKLGPRVLDVCTVVSRAGQAQETPFAALHAFCRQMCPKPRLLPHSIYGHNDWNYAYGNNSAASTMEVTHRIVSLAPKGPNRPYVVIDDGWESAGPGKAGPWDGSNGKFPDMAGLAAEVKKAGGRPGLWIRPTTAWDALPASWRLSRNHGALDPTVPEVTHQIASDMARIQGWGYELIKHDFTSYDLMGRWGEHMGATLTDDDWAFAEGPGRTTAEIILALYRTIRGGAGDAAVLGCNTFSHLSAGIFEAQRIGDDTSGRSWDRTRKMGINCLAFRSAQDGAFYATDPDIAAVTHDVPWEMTRQWLDLVARSGAVLFVALQTDAVGGEQEDALRAAFAHAAQTQTMGEPLDWLTTSCPERWRLGGQETQFHWQISAGASPFGV